MKFYDTNALLRNYKTINEKFLLSSTTLTELEDIKSSGKKDEDTRYLARKTAKFLNLNEDLYDTIIVTDEILNILKEFHLKDTPDNEICACAYQACKNSSIEFITYDLNCRSTARKIFKLSVGNLSVGEDIYKGYRLLSGDSSSITDYMINGYKEEQWITNQYLLISNTETKKESEMRYDGKKFVPLILPKSDFVKGKNALQRCALDILYNPNIEIAAILGGYGSGKTFLSMKMAAYAFKEGNQAKILGVREPVGEGKEIGFLPGDQEAKTDPFFDPLAQQLDMGEDEINALKDKNILSTNIPFFMKGNTYSDTIIIVDEAEDLNERQLKLVGTRMGENSRIFFAGDYKQSLINKSCDNPLIKMGNEFKGKENFACIYLEEDVRSSASKMFADLFEK